MTASPDRRRPGRVRRLFFALATPWVIASAAFGAAVLAFPASTWGVGHMPLKPGLAVGVSTSAIAAGPGEWRLVGVQWTRRAAFAPGWEWMAWDDGFGWRRNELWFHTTTFGHGFAAAKPDRPPDLVAVGVAIPWLLGVPAVWSVLSVWRAVRRGAEPSPLASSARALWPWGVTFALVGAGLLTNGLTLPEGAGPNGTVVMFEVERDPRGDHHPRAVRSALVRLPLPAGTGSVMSSRSATVGFWWLILIPAVCNAGRAVADCRSRRAAA